MNDIKVSVNLATFSIMLIVWLVILGLKLGKIEIPDDLNTMFSIITGGLLFVVQGFEKGIAFKPPEEPASAPNP